MINELSNIKNNQLLKNFSGLVAREKEITASVVRYLSEIFRRRLFAQEGYSSLFSYLVEKYHYSRSSAYRRIQAAKLSLRFPEIIDLLAQGKLNLMAVCLIEPHMTFENGDGLIEKIMGKSKEEIEYLISDLFSEDKDTSHRDKIRRLPVIEKECKASPTVGLLKNVIPNAKREESPSGSLGRSLPQSPIGGPRDVGFLNGPTVGVEDSLSVQTQKIQIRKVKIEFVADEKIAKKIERAKEILRHKYPKARLEEIFDEALEALLEKRAPERKIARIEKRKENQKARQTVKVGALKKCHPEGGDSVVVGGRESLSQGEGSQMEMEST